MTQRQRVLEYMQEHGSITSMEAFRKLGVTRLSAVIFDLKAQGHEFDTAKEKSKNRFGEKTSYARYILRD
ncbi:MAG: helix-turn-helix domain-containing protein [Alloprevotella sp.]|nr:helix-turn-helix domain-containing protein [Alloprevotella sp.]